MSEFILILKLYQRKAELQVKGKTYLWVMVITGLGKHTEEAQEYNSA